MIYALFPKTTPPNKLAETIKAIKAKHRRVALFGYGDTQASSADIVAPRIHDEAKAAEWVRSMDLEAEHVYLEEGELVVVPFVFNSANNLEWTRRFALVVNAYAGDRHLLPDVLAEWDRQIGGLPIQKLVAYDGTKAPKLPRGWSVVPNGGKIHNEPQPLRNAALFYDVDWLQYWDADNFPREGHLLEAMQAARMAREDVGVLYPTIYRGGKELLTEAKGDPRQGYFIDTASVWRREAIFSAGGWRSGINTEDSILATRMGIAGWKIQRSGVCVDYAKGVRTASYNPQENVWKAREFGIVILLRGDWKLLKRVEKDLALLRLPPRCGLTVMVDSQCKRFQKRARKLLAAREYQRTAFLVAEPAKWAVDNFVTIHSRVADLYTRAIGATPEETILTWEDDVRPEPEAMAELSNQLLHFARHGAVGAPYLARKGRGVMDHDTVSAATSRDYWEGKIVMEDIVSDRHMVGMLSGGFTLWQRAALEECPILGPYKVIGKGSGYLGWDGSVCRRLNQAGWRLFLARKSKVKHITI